MAGVASIWNLTAVSIDRYVHVCRPLTHSRFITKQRVLFMIVFIWIFSLGISLMKGLHFEWEKPNYEMLVSCVGFFIPLILIIFCYLRIYRVVRKQLKKFKEQTKCLHNQKRFATDLKAIKMIAIVVLAVFICWGPFFIVNIWYGWCLYEHADESGMQICKPNTTLVAFIKWLHYANSAINPIIYACFNREFRNGFKIALYKRLSTTENGAFSKIINRTSLRENLNNSVQDAAVSPNLSSGPPEKHLNGSLLIKRHSIAGVNNKELEIENKAGYQTQVAISSSEEAQLLMTPRVEI